MLKKKSPSQMHEYMHLVSIFMYQILHLNCFQDVMFVPKLANCIRKENQTKSN